MSNELNYTTLPLSRLKLNTGQIPDVPKNPRFIRDEKYKKLVESIRDTPEMMTARPLIVYPMGEDYVTLAGNMRLRAMRELKWKECPCTITAEGTDAKKLREYAIKDNLGYGEDDMDLLANEWDLEELTEWGMDLIFPEVEEEEVNEVHEDDFDENAEVVHVSKEGDVFILGDHRLVCGDSLKEETYQKLLHGEEADLMLTDPPYNVAYEGATEEKMTIKNDCMKDKEFFDFLHKFYAEASKHLKRGGGVLHLARIIRNSQFCECAKRYSALAEADYCVGKKHNGSRKTRLPMEARTLHLRMERRCRTLFL